MSTRNVPSANLQSQSQIAGSEPALCVAHGDGIGPEIMDATLHILDAAETGLAYRTIEVGESVYRKGHSSGIAPDAWDTLRSTGVLLKGPITTPQGGGVKSLNVTIRKTLGLFANIRPCIAYDPYIPIQHPHMDVVIIRENEEDLYAGIEHRQTDEVYQCLKLITRPGTEKIVRYAFEYARRRGRQKVTCLSKDNIMKLTDGLFHKVFDEIGEEYPELEREHMIVDIGMARLANAPYLFDVVVTPNLYGDIVSDIAAEVSGSVGLAPSANIGEGFAMFEAIHGSAPTIAGQNVANPSGLLLSAVKMLAHLGLGEKATLIHNAWLRTIEEGIHTGQMLFRPQTSTSRVGTREFAQAVADRLGEKPRNLKAATYASDRIPLTPPIRRAPAKKELVGVDVFLHWLPGAPDDLAEALQKASTEDLKLRMITNRGVKVWPQGLPETFLTDHWRCRFQHPDGKAVDGGAVLKLLGSIHSAGLDFIKTEHLYHFDGVPGFSLGQGQ
ncbi:MAG: NADP-dependent isocitrate dehydrogenase [Bryobacterales bacterium]|nr:NADP-dependent isocitrate dehydrogenase [Bryobacterales bacterium]